jgi:4-amino-4-deoxy-L-arabinose transferase-like glycosyltransferase
VTAPTAPAPRPPASERPPRPVAVTPEAPPRRLPLWALLATAVLVAIGLYLSAPRTWAERPVANSPLQNVTYELANRWAHDGKPVVPLEEYDRLPDDVAPALSPRDAGVRNGEVVPGDHPLPVAVLAVAARVGTWAVPLVVPIAGGVAAVLLALLTFELTRSRLAAAAAVVALLPTAGFWLSASNTASSDTIGLVALLGAVLVLLRAPPTPRALVGAGALAATAVAARYTNALAVGALLVAVAWLRPELRRRAGWLLAPLAVGALLLGGYHTWVYGAPWRTGYGIGSALAARTANPDKAGLFSYRFESLSSHVRLYLLRPETLALLVLGGVGVVAAVRGRRAGPKVVAAVLAAGAVTVLGYYAGRNTWGVVSFQANASFLRYLLPVVAMTAVLVGVGVSALRGRWRWAAFAAVLVVSIGAADTTVRASSGLELRRDAIDVNRELRDAVLGATGPESLIIVNRADKLLWPERSTLVASYLARNREAQARGLTSVFDLTPDGARLADVIGRLCRGGDEVHLLDDAGWLDDATAADLDVRLGAEGIDRTTTTVAGVELSTFVC